ncbi:MAG: hypothetical protein DCC55_16245 [Chloroflexi bacterium]|nr:MAG: hypothetical protein DCC55_16245 [Chloroflexota bacterium]
MQVIVANPLLRTPLALIVDDSCPVINLTHHWIRQRQAWKARFQPQVGFKASDGDPDKLSRVPETIPADFAVKWAEWCGEQGVKGKFSLVPYPAGVARVDQGLPGYPRHEFERWMRVYRDLICPNFDLTCEMLTHTHVVDLATWQFTDAWEQYEWVDPPVEPLTDYIATAMTLMHDTGLPCEGVTSPGAFGSKQEAAYARATLEAAQRVFGNERPFYFLHVYDPPHTWPDVPLWYADQERGIAIASVIGCTHDWFGSWTGYDAGDPDRFITADLRGGVLPPVLDRELPCVLVGHWPGFYFGGAETGFDVLKAVKRRLDAYDPDRTKTLWMKTSAIGHYWMARQLSDFTVEPLEDGRWQVIVTTRFPTANFTLVLDQRCAQVQVDGQPLRQVYSRQQFAENTFVVEGNQTAVAFPLALGATTLKLALA